MGDDIRAMSRGKRSDTKEWVIGYLRAVDPFRFSMKMDTEGESLVEIDVETYGKCTGMSDKNNVRVFEGDIVKGKNNGLYLVYFSTIHQKFVLLPLSGKSGSLRMFVKTMRNFEVVGNQFDNPELMKGFDDDNEMR